MAATENPNGPAGSAQSAQALDAELKASVNLPKTDFPMKASLPQREPKQLALWEEERIYEKMLAKNAGRPRFVFHDGPPYANGHLHCGTVLNKVLKDMVVKYANMSGRLAEFVPGWDCHGLPIELKTEEELGKKRKELDKVTFRRACRAYAERFIDIQRAEFKRVGVFATWADPYLTMSYDYEATTVRELAKVVRRGAMVRGKKPIYWCVRDRTALAEAEVEYDDHASPSIYVAFPLENDGARGASLVIWTTTPWTLPANLAICVNRSFAYVTYELKGRRCIVAKERLIPFLKECAPEELTPSEPPALAHPERIVESMKGEALVGLRYGHVLNGRSCPVIAGEHVTLESGTGLVHTAPGHGADDYDVGRENGLEVLSPVDAGGRFTEEAGELAGQGIFEANPRIVEMLSQRGVLLSPPELSISHSYPHCWRCKRPVIFRATPQWFISMEKTGLRRRALEELDKVEWIPKWGYDRIHGMLANRPDWCISRQRTWGVPIPVFYCESCEEPLVDADVMDRVADAFTKAGADAWFTESDEALLGAHRRCAKCGHERFRRESDILDVWFDSGVSQAAVAAKRENLGLPADLYLEGSDQHRGWFHSSLLCALGARDESPYRSVLTHGFVVDSQGRKMAKSAGNYIPAEKVIAEQGAEIMRLWVASSDYREDVRISDEILKKLAEGYRKIRNTLRYCLGNLHDFDPKADAVPRERMAELDRWALARLNVLIAKVRAAYEAYEYHVVYHAVLDLCAVELSALYFDIIKDRLYTSGARSEARRSAQTALHEILLTLLELLAPIISFTADEAYRALPHRAAESIFLLEMPQAKLGEEERALLARYEQLFEVRGRVQGALEEARRAGTIGSSLEARVLLELSGGEEAELLHGCARELPTLFIVSQVELSDKKEGVASGGAEEKGGLSCIKVERARGEKCPRCWQYNEGVAPQQLCSKCREALAR